MAISRVQGKTVGTDTVGTTIAGSLTSGITQGNLVIAELKSGAQNMTITPPDTSWKQAVLNSGSTAVTTTTAIYYLVVDAAHAGQTSWTWTFSGSHSMFVMTTEWSTTTSWPASPVDQTATNLAGTATTTFTAGTTPTTTQAEELWIALFNYAGAGQTTSGLTAGWTADLTWSASSSNSSGLSAYEIASATGVASPSVTIGVAEKWAGDVATFKDAPAGNSYNRTLSDALSALDVTAKTPQKAQTETISAADTVTKVTQKPESDTFSALDTLSHTWNAYLTLSEAISSLDSLQKSLQRALLDSFSQLDSVSAAKSAGGTAWRQVISDSFSSTDAIAWWTLTKLVGDTLSGVDGLTKSVRAPLYDVLSGQDTLFKQLQRQIQDTFSETDAVSAGRAFFVQLLDALSLTDVPFETYTKVQYGQLALAMSLVSSAFGLTISFSNSQVLGMTLSLLPTPFGLGISLQNTLALTPTLLPSPLAESFFIL